MGKLQRRESNWKEVDHHLGYTRAVLRAQSHLLDKRIIFSPNSTGSRTSATFCAQTQDYIPHIVLERSHVHVWEGSAYDSAPQRMPNEVDVGLHPMPNFRHQRERLNGLESSYLGFLSLQPMSKKSEVIQGVLASNTSWQCILVQSSNDKPFPPLES